MWWYIKKKLTVLSDFIRIYIILIFTCCCDIDVKKQLTAIYFIIKPQKTNIK